MFDVAWSELLLVAIVAILVVGPKELPALLRTIGQMLGKLRRSADEFRKQFDEAVKEAGGEDLQREMRALKKNNPLNQIRDTLDEAARDPFKPGAQKSGTGAAAPIDDADDVDGPDGLGEPPPPLPPRNAAAAPATPAPPADAKPAASGEPAKEASGNGAAHELRVNGEHRPAS